MCIIINKANLNPTIIYVSLCTRKVSRIAGIETRKPHIMADKRFVPPTKLSAIMCGRALNCKKLKYIYN